MKLYYEPDGEQFENTKFKQFDIVARPSNYSEAMVILGVTKILGKECYVVKRVFPQIDMEDGSLLMNCSVSNMVMKYMDDTHILLAGRKK